MMRRQMQGVDGFIQTEVLPSDIDRYRSFGTLAGLWTAYADVRRAKKRLYKYRNALGYLQMLDKLSQRQTEIYDAIIRLSRRTHVSARRET